MLIVQKYGGTSVADTACIQRAARRLAETARQGHQVVAVVSAQGDLTDRLLAKIDDLDGGLGTRETDACLSAGEQISAALIAMALQQQNCPAVSLTGWQAGLVTDSHYGNARIRLLRGERIRKELEQGKVVVVAGYQGIDRAENITTLGRGGSDTTAVALTALLEADRCLIYTDVDGVYDRDPRIHKDAVRYDSIDYESMLRLCQSGAQVLHDRSVELARDFGIQVEVLSAFTGTPGTTVGEKDGPME